MQSYPQFSILSESAVCVTFGEKPEEAVWQQLHGLNGALLERPFEGFWASVPAFVTLTVHFDVLKVFGQQPAGLPAETVLNYLKSLLGGRTFAQSIPAPPIDIPVRYGGAFGPDLPEVADHLGLTAEAIIQLHADTLFRVFMIGFAPGFPYLGTLPAALELPRKNVIAPKVPAGSVAIAGDMTCIYPQDSPAGWHVIGQTDVRLFDPTAAAPCLLKAGMQVRFIPQPL